MAGLVIINSSNFTQRDNVTLTEPKAYVFLTVKDGYKTFFMIWSVALIVLGVLVNNLMLYITKQDSSVGHHTETTTCTKKHIVYYFFFNLAISDAAGSLIAIPLLILELSFGIIVKNDVACRISRFHTLLFPTVTLFLLLVITAERFLSLVTPSFILRQSIARKIVCLAWVWSSFIVCLGLPSYQYRKWDLNERQYTFLCTYSSGKERELRVLYMLFVCFAYLIPCVLVVILSIFIANRIRKSSSPLTGALPAFVNEREKQKTTKVLLSVVGAFVLPYLAYIMYGLLRTTGLLPETSYQTDITLRYFWAMLAYTNVVVNPMVVLFQIKSLRIRLRAKLGLVNQVSPEAQVPQNLAPGLSLRTMRESEQLTLSIPDPEAIL